MLDRLAWWLRLPVAGFRIGDLVLAGLFCAVAVASVLTGNPNEGPVYITLPVAVVTTTALAWRVRVPAVSVLLVIASDLVQTITTQAPGSLWSLVVSIIVVYSVAAHYPEGRAAVGGLVIVGSAMLQERIDNGVDYLFIALLFGGTWLLGRASRLWRTRVGRAEEHQNDLATLAVAEERLRIARELHDVLAHSLTVIAVQADAADAALARDPALAREPIQVIHATARSSLNEIRETLHLLRSPRDTLGESARAGQPLRPAPGLGAIDELFADARNAGLTVESRVAHGIGPLSPVVDLTVYRIVQEALTNVTKHAGPTKVRVVVRRSSESIELDVSNAPGTPAPGPSGAGVGLLGIRERVALVGGTFEVGAIENGDWRLRAELPLDGGVR